MKAGALNDGGAGLVYRGSLVFRRDSLGMLSFESALIAAGRITAGGVRYHVTDHLGSVRAVVDGTTGNLLEASDYEAYGLRSDVANLPSGLSVSPYAYCAGDPVNMVDVDGEMPHVLAGALGGLAVGAIVSGSIAFHHGQRGREFWGSVVGGAVNGAVSGALVAAIGGVSLVSTGAKELLANTLGGALGGVAGSATEQAISKGSIDSSQLINDTSFGAVSGAVSGGLNHLSSYNKVNIQSHYMSSKTQDNLTKEVAREYKSMGKQISGKATKQTIQKEVSERTTTLITVSQTFEEGICNTVDVAQRYIFQVGDYQMNSFLFDE